jgi:hypothetical protein
MLADATTHCGFRIKAGGTPAYVIGSISKPFFRRFPAMRAAGPATGAPLAGQYVFLKPDEPGIPRFLFFRRGHPANPLIL